MRDSFVTDEFVLDLSGIKISYVEQSPRFKDTFFTKYSFPFEFHMDALLRASMGNYTHMNAQNLAHKYKGWHIVEGRIRRGTLEIVSVQGDKVQAEIHSGFEELVNFFKKLSQLPFKKKEVGNIYAHAGEICRKKYPETDYNFPLVIYNRHAPTEAGWQHFNGFINDRIEGVFQDNLEFATPTRHENRNIMQAMPYLLHVLKVGFADAGYELAGEILEDEDLKQRVLYAEPKIIERSKEVINTPFQWEDNEAIVKGYRELTIIYRITYSGIYEFSGTYIGNGRIMHENIELKELPINAGTFVTTVEATSSDKLIIVKLLVTDAQAQMERDAIFKGQLIEKKYIENGQESFKMYNPPVVDLKNSVPDMSFGELVTLIKNWKNYDLEIQGNRIVMNTLKIDQITQMVDLRQWEVNDPTRTYSHKRSFEISLADIGDDTKWQVLIDDKGIHYDKNAKTETTQIQINGYCLPLKYFKGRTTAMPAQDANALGLIYYDGLNKEHNTAQNPPGLMLPEITQAWKEWYQMRINNTEIKWSFIANKNQFRHIGIRDTLYAYGQLLWIKEMTKNVLSEDLYQIELITEAIQGER